LEPEREISDIDRLITDPLNVVRVSVRTDEMADLLRATQTSPAAIEYSALIGLAVHMMAVSQGLPIDDETLSRFSRLLFGRIAPIIEEVVRDFEA
jgi:hypothetical protein